MDAKGATGVWKARVETLNSGREMKMNCIWRETKAKGFPDSRQMLHNFIVPHDKPYYCFMFYERPRGNLKLFMSECSTQHHVDTGEKKLCHFNILFCAAWRSKAGFPVNFNYSSNELFKTWESPHVSTLFDTNLSCRGGNEHLSLIDSWIGWI